MSGLFDDDDRDSKRTLTPREKDILWIRAKKKCEICGDKVERPNMLAGHNIAWSKRGHTTLKNSLCLCYGCNNRQRTETASQIRKKLGIKDETEEKKEALKQKSIYQLKFLAKKFNAKVKGHIEGDFFGESTVASSKNKYVNQLAKILSKNDIESALKDMPKPEKKKKARRRSDSIFDW
ncbi:hypothetical protein J4234_00325 [Candidatus Woesearchaeota archaeon]|nr:hypothetical protein [Candidatus Woesearchaeota archaeon]